MAADIKSETVELDGQNVVLISVKEGAGIIGTCSAGHLENTGSISTLTRLFYIGSDPVINLVCPNHANKVSEKLVSFSPGFQGYDQKINGALTSGFNRLNDGESLATGLREIMGLLQDGVYVAYFSDYYPTDGAGAFFWGAYNISHEVRGTAEQNHLIGNKTYKPCFLLPTQPMDYFAPKTKVGTDDQVKMRRVQGIVYHVSGFFSALLKGHHGAVSCVDKNLPFRCAVIERITDPYLDKVYTGAPAPAKQPEPKPEAEKPAEENAENAPENASAPEAQPAPAVSPTASNEELPTETISKPKTARGITGFRSPSVKIPLEAFPKDMLRQIIEGRPEYKPGHFNILSAKLQTVRRKSINNNALPYVILERAEQMPDCEMILKRRLLMSE